jgi:hypothetical protein
MLKSNVLKNIKIKIKPKYIPKSPKRFIIIAFIADLFACILVNQKFINKYEDKPTPSHAKNKYKKLFDNNNNNI